GTLFELRAHLEERVGELDKALRDRRRVRELRPKDTGAWASSVRAHVVVGDFAGALAEADLGLESVPSSDLVRAWRARVLNRLGGRSEPVEGLDDIVRRDPSYGDFQAFFAEVLVDSGRGAEAIPHATNAMQFYDDRQKGGLPWLIRGRALRQTGDPAGARSDLEEALRRRLIPDEERVAKAELSQLER